MTKKSTFLKCVVSFAFTIVMLFSNAQVTSSFSVNQSQQCFNGNSFVFTNTSSSGAGITYAWNFGDGTTSTATNPTKSYSAAGYYSVQLVTDSGGISHYYNSTVVVNPLPVASFYSIASTTSGNSYTFISTSTIANGVMNYFWNFGDGTTSTLVNPIKSYSNTGTYNVKLVVTSDAGCADSITQSIVISLTSISSGFTINTNSNQCLLGNSYTFNNTSTSGVGVTYLWNFGDGTTSTAATPTHSYTTSGNYTITLTVSSSGFADAVSSQSVYVGNPTASFSVNSNGSSFSFNSNAANAVSYSWDLGDGTTASGSSVSNKVYTPGNYNVKLVVTGVGGCKDSTTQSIVATPYSGNPIPAFTLNTSQQCLTGNNFVFSNASTAAAGTTYLWIFGDGTTANTTNTSHTYATAGYYNVQLKATYNGNDFYTNQQVIVKPMPVAAYTYTVDTTTANTFIFHNAATLSSGNMSFVWDFGDGSATSTITNPTHTYPSAGPYNAKLTITSDGGCVDSATQAIAALPVPTTAFTVTSATTQCSKGSLFTFNNTSTSGSGVSYNWNFGDGSSSTLSNPTKTYTSAGIYTVTLTTSTSGGSTSATQTVTVNPSPNVSFSSSVAGNIATFTNSTSISSGTISTYNWDFGDGFTSTSTNPVKNFADGSYSVKLIATSDLGCLDSTTNTVSVGALPTAAFTVSSATTQCSNSDNYTFNNTSTTGVGVTYLWNFGDGTTSTLYNPTKSYTGAGTFVVNLTVTNAVGSVTTSQSVVVLAGPTVGFTTLSNTNAGNSFTFISTSSVPAGTMTYYWNLGDGTLVNSTVNVTHTYAAPGTYTVKLVVVGSGGCSDSSSSTVTVCPTATAAFNVSSTTSQCMAGNSFTYVNASSNNAGIPTSSMTYNWSFGDSTFSTLENPPAHSYATWGDYDVKLVVTLTSGSCVIKDSITKLHIVSVEPMPVASYRLILDNFYVPTALLSDTTKRCWHYGYDFSYQSSSTLGRGTMDYFWHFGTSALYFRDGDSSHYINPRIVFDTASTYPVQLMVVSDKGCKDSVTRIVELSDPRSRFNYTIDSTTDVYASPVVTVTDVSYDYGGYLVAWNWNFGSSASPASSNSQTPSSFSYACGGTKSVVLTVTSDVGCTVDTTRSFVIRIKPKAAFTISAPNYTPNAFARPTFTYNNGTTVNDACPVMSYAWNFGDGYSGTGTTPTHIYKGSGTYTTTMVATNGNGGKKDTTTQTVTVSIKPRAIFSTSQTVTPNAYSAPTVTYTNSTTSQDTAAPVASLTYAWDFGDGTTSSLRFPPTHQYANGGTYTVTLTVTNNVSGLTDVATQNVVIKYKPQAAFTSNVDYGGNVYSNPTVDFTDATTSNDGAPTYTYSWNFGDGSPVSTLQNPSHQYAAGGTYSVTLTVTNTNGGLTDVVSHNVDIVITPQAVISVHSSIVSTPIPLSIGTIDYKSYTITGVSNGLNPSTVVTGSIAHTDITVDSIYIPRNDTALYAQVVDADVTFGIQNDTIANYGFRVRLIVTSNLGVSDTAYAWLGASESGFAAYRSINHAATIPTITLPSIGIKNKPVIAATIPVESKKGLSIYPNPAAYTITVATDIPAKTSDVKLMMYNMNGKLVVTQKNTIDNVNATRTNIPVNISNLSSGTYNIVVLDNRGVILGIGKCIKSVN